jgi:multicomponent Na+:H+ antiporter subunit G
MIDIIRLIACILLTGAGIGCLVSGVVGVFRFKYSLNRIHAAALLDTVGILLMLLGVIVATGFNFTSLKILVVIAFLWLTSPVSGHLIGRMEITINDDLNKSMAVIDRETVEHEKDADVPADTKEAN